ncbi:MAG: PepSY domain-containing protein [Maricaulaceae bacterium]
MAFLSFTFAASAEASTVRKHKSEYRYVKTYQKVAQKRISASQAKSIASKKVRNAQVLDVALNGNVYKVRMQKKNGRIVDVYVDATTGRVR